MRVSDLTQLLALSLSWIAFCNGILRDIRAYRSMILALHNRYRRAENAANMKELRWDPYLERRAAGWSEQCHWGHQSRGLGENLAMFWTTGPSLSIANIIIQSHQNWWSEIRGWSWSTSCGSACHYTQMVWGKTERVGCSLSKCPALSNAEGAQNADFFVCFYDPPGNFIGQYPYTPGRNCAMCDYGEVCRRRLCAKGRGRIYTYNQNNQLWNRRNTNNQQRSYRRSYLPYRSTRRYMYRPRSYISYRSGLWGIPTEPSEPGEGPSESASEAAEL